MVFYITIVIKPAFNGLFDRASQLSEEKPPQIHSTISWPKIGIADNKLVISFTIFIGVTILALSIHGIKFFAFFII